MSLADTGQRPYESANPQRDSNPCYRLERAASWAARRWGLELPTGPASLAGSPLGLAGHDPFGAVGAVPLLDPELGEPVPSHVGVVTAAVGAGFGPDAGDRLY